MKNALSKIPLKVYIIAIILAISGIVLLYLQILFPKISIIEGIALVLFSNSFWVLLASAICKFCKE